MPGLAFTDLSARRNTRIVKTHVRNNQLGDSISWQRPRTRIFENDSRTRSFSSFPSFLARRPQVRLAYDISSRQITRYRSNRCTAWQSWGGARGGPPCLFITVNTVGLKGRQKAPADLRARRKTSPRCTGCKISINDRCLPSSRHSLSRLPSRSLFPSVYHGKTSPALLFYRYEYLFSSPFGTDFAVASFYSESHLWMAAQKWMERPAERPARSGPLSFDPDDRKIERRDRNVRSAHYARRGRGRGRS